MLTDSKAFGGFSANDIATAKHFYGDTLGIRVKETMGGMVLQLHISGSIPAIVYQKGNHEPATFTVLNFPVVNIEEAVSALKAKGVAFESYDSADLKTDADNISRGGGPKIAWFKDPAGNILSVIQEE